MTSRRELRKQVSNLKDYLAQKERDHLNQEANLNAHRIQLQKANLFLDLLLELEPSLEKYLRAPDPENETGEGYRFVLHGIQKWDVDGMIEAKEFRTKQATANKYIPKKETK